MKSSSSSSTAYAVEQGPNVTGELFLKTILENDPDALAKLYAPDAVLYPPSEPFEARGRDAIRAVWAQMMGMFTVTRCEIIDGRHETHDDVSFGWGRFRMTLVPKAGGETVSMEGRFVDVSKLINGKWLYVVDHASIPVAPQPQS